MASRGDVLRLKRRLGFGAKGEAEAAVVVQADELNDVMSTWQVVPLDPAVGASAPSLPMTSRRVRLDVCVPPPCDHSTTS